jgi:hypothetical protein
LGAAGANEAIYSILMMQNNFVCASANIEDLDPEAEGMPIVRECEHDVHLNCVISNSFGFLRDLQLFRIRWHQRHTRLQALRGITQAPEGGNLNGET